MTLGKDAVLAVVVTLSLAAAAWGDDVTGNLTALPGQTLAFQTASNDHEKDATAPLVKPFRDGEEPPIRPPRRTCGPCVATTARLPPAL